MDKRNLSSIFKIVGIVVTGVSILLIFAPFVSLRLGEVGRDYSGIDLVLDFEGKINSGSFGGIGIFAGFVLSIGVLLTNLLPTGQKNKNLTTEQLKKVRSMNLIMSGFLAVVAFILKMCVVSMTGFGDNPLAHLGWGATLSGILLLLGAISFGISGYFEGVTEQKKDNSDSNNQNEG